LSGPVPPKPRPEAAHPQFLDLKSYRRKRLIEAAKLLPVLGAICVLFPLPYLFLAEPGAQTVARGQAATQSATPLAIYFFVVWIALIGAAFVLARALGRRTPGA